MSDKLQVGTSSRFWVMPRRRTVSASGLMNNIVSCSSLGCLLPASGVIGLWLAFIILAPPAASLASRPQPPFDGQSWLLTGLGLAAGIYGIFLVVAFLFSDYAARRSDAEKRRQKALEALNICRERAAKSNVNLTHAEGWLAKCDYEFQSNAYAPFWDAIENAARFLDLCQSDYAAIQKERVQYYEALSPSRHNFPIIESQLEPLKDPEPALSDFHRLLRQGQTNLGFAQIWEHRATRQSIVEGFRTLAEGIRHLEATMVKSIEELRRSISSDLNRVIAFQGQIIGAIQAVAARPSVQHVDIRVRDY